MKKIILLDKSEILYIIKQLDDESYLTKQEKRLYDIFVNKIDNTINNSNKSKYIIMINDRKDALLFTQALNHIIVDVDTRTKINRMFYEIFTKDKKIRNWLDIE